MSTGEPTRLELAFTGLTESLTQAKCVRRACWHALHLSVSDGALLERAEMIAEELCENLVKYADWQAEIRPGFWLRLDAGAGTLRMWTRNALPKQGGHRERLLELAKSLSEKTPAVAFRERLEATFSEEPEAQSAIGLLRVAFEGEAALDIRIEGDEQLLLCATLDVVI